MLFSWLSWFVGRILAELLLLLSSLSRLLRPSVVTGGLFVGVRMMLRPMGSGGSSCGGGSACGVLDRLAGMLSGIMSIGLC